MGGQKLPTLSLINKKILQIKQYEIYFLILFMLNKSKKWYIDDIMKDR
jgi:hypothetical protein